MVRKIQCLVILVLALALPAVSHAQVGIEKKHKSYKDNYMVTGSVKGPFYDPHSKSYFELRWRKKGRKWRQAYLEAQTLEYKGTKGRLALVKDLEIHSFIQTHFNISAATWIGLQYYCDEQRLNWADNSTLQKGDFSAWHYQWARRDDIRCGFMSRKFTPGLNMKSHMGVSYIPLSKGMPAMWQASGPEKEYDFFIVEYPTGKE
ncbi:C-type lectin domain-containing protein [Emcibacter sp.]|uniref:C-type lectin domain-containing protein n=1 Tax=Emcibacter sp. TaxID=1979954 RepID=UPI003A8D679B